MNDKKAAVISAALGTLAGAASALLIMLIFAFVCVKIQSVQTALSEPVSLAAGCGGAFAGGILCARIIKKNGMMFGGICAALVFLVLFIISALSGAQPDVHALLRLAAMLPVGAIGGIIGVNRRKKRRKRR